ncbi:unnamed protein product, partial [Mesorhabditis belari]|uniref:Uncharacterized protein n=1 Tax=Mesorhabditis belari TaxID=2138241 RepID=A0AAF3EGD4_9BILA
METLNLDKGMTAELLNGVELKEQRSTENATEACITNQPEIILPISDPTEECENDTATATAKESTEAFGTTEECENDLLVPTARTDPTEEFENDTATLISTVETEERENDTATMAPTPTTILVPIDPTEECENDSTVPTIRADPTEECENDTVTLPPIKETLTTLPTLNLTQSTEECENDTTTLLPTTGTRTTATTTSVITEKNPSATIEKPKVVDHGLNQERAHKSTDLLDIPCATEGIVLFQKPKFQGPTLGLCFRARDGCLDLPVGWAYEIESVYVSSAAGCYVLYTSPNCEGMEMKVTFKKVQARRTENLGDSNLARRHCSIRACAQWERFHK